MMRLLGAPMPRAAATYSRSRRLSTSARETRAYDAHWVMPMITTTVSRLPPSTALRVIRRASVGKAIRVSMTREST
jgi:hypothetical protein